MLRRILISLVILAISLLVFSYLNKPQDNANRSNRQVSTAAAEDQNPAPTETESKRGDKPSDSDKPVTTDAAKTKKTDAQRPSNRRGGAGGLRSGVLAKQAATSVEVLRAQPKLQQASLKLYGLVEAQKSTLLTTATAAEITSVNVVEGQLVNKGDLLLTLSASSAQAQLTQKQLSLSEMAARIRTDALKHNHDLATQDIEKELLRIAKNALERFTSLNDKQLGSSTDYEAALRTYQNQLLSNQTKELNLAQYADNRAQLLSQQNLLISQVEQAQSIINDLKPKAPFDGVVAKLPIKLNQAIRAGESLIELYDPKTLVLSIRVPVRYRLDLLDFDALQAVDSQGQQWHVKSIRPVNESGAQRIIFTPANTQTVNHLPGTHLSAVLTYPTTVKTVSIPTTALYDQQRVYVFSRGVVEGIDIDVIGQTESGFLISANTLPEKAQIITTRLKNPVNGMAVSLANRGEGKRQ